MRADERVKPLEAYRGEEMARSHECFFGADRSYHEARRNFVYKISAPCVVAPVTPRPDAAREFVVNTTSGARSGAPLRPRRRRSPPEPARLSAVPVPAEPAPLSFVTTTTTPEPTPRG